MNNIKQNNNKLMWLYMAISCSSTILLLGVYIPSVVVRSFALCLASFVVFYIFRDKLQHGYVSKSDTFFHILAAFICFAEMNYAYKPWTAAALLFDVDNLLGINYISVVTAATLSLAILSYGFVVYAIKFTVKGLLELNREKLKAINPYVKALLILAAIYIFASLTIFRANYVYKDDMQRIVNGTTVYTRESRTFAELVMALLEMDFFFADLSPITQIIELVLMAASAMIVLAVFTDGKKASFMDIIAMVPFGISPYFLECISFKYDPPQHGLAVFFALFPLLFYKKADKRKYMAIVALCIMISAASHQVAMTVFPAAVIILAIIKWNKDGVAAKDLAKSLIYPSIFGYVIGLAAFKLIIMHSIGYNTGLSTLHSIKDFIPGMLKNYYDFYDHVIHQYKPVWLILMFVLCLCFYFEFSLRSRQDRGAAFILNLVGCILLILLANSLYPVLQAPLHSPRHMYSFGIFIGMVIIAVVSVYDNGPVIAKTSASLLAACFVVFSIKYGNLLSYQQDYTRYRIEMVVDELSDMELIKSGEDIAVQIIGSTGYSPAVEALPSSDRLMRTLITTSFDEYFGTWSASGFYNLYGLNVHYYVGTDPDLREMNLPLIKDNYYYNLYSDDSYILIELKERSDVAWTVKRW